MTVYRVVGRVPYRGHRPGATFETRLHPTVESRAVQRHAIEVVDSSNPQLVPGSYRLHSRAADAAESEGSDDPTDPDQGVGPDGA